MSFWNRTMEWLGLGPDDYDDDYLEYDEYEEDPRPQRRPEPEPRVRPRVDQSTNGSEGVVRTMPSRPTFPSRDFDPGASRRDDSGVHPRSQRPQPPQRPSEPPSGSISLTRAEPATITPRRFDQAQEVADTFKDGQPVIMNLDGADREVARRLIDFASGLCYGLDGSMEKISTGVYLIKPPVGHGGGMADPTDDDPYADLYD